MVHLSFSHFLCVLFFIVVAICDLVREVKTRHRLYSRGYNLVI